jgi:hypothetical protein
MKRIYTFSALIIALIWACGNNETTEETTTQETPTAAVEIEEGWKGLAILESGYKFGIEVPDNSKSDSIINIEFLEDRGELEITVGNNFDIFIVEDESQMLMVKNELKTHPFYNVEFIVENDSSLLYRLYDNEGTKEQWQMYSERKIGASTLLIRSNETSDYSEFEAKLMLQSALSISKF